MNPDISALAAYGGAYEKKLFSTLFNELDFTDLTVIPNVKNDLNLTKLSVASGVRPYSSVFQPPTDDLDYSGRVLSAKLAKRDIEIEPLKYQSTWMAEMLTPGTDPQSIPFAPYVWEQVIKKVASEVNDSATYLGVYNSAGTTAVAVATGYGTIIANEITGGNLVPIVTGAITNVNAVSKFELMMKSMPSAYRRAGFNLYVSYDLSDKYQEDYRERYKKYVSMNEDGSFFIDNTSRKVKITPVTWMGTSQRIIATPKENMLVGTDRLSDLQKINTHPTLYTLQAGIVFTIGYNFRDLSAMRVNDVA